MSDRPARKPEAAHPWDRLETESDKAFAAFRVYLEAGPENRSIAKVVEHRAKAGLGKSRSTVSAWSSKHRWRARAEAFDQEGAKRSDQTAFEVLEERGRRQAEIAVRMLDALEAPVEELERRLADEASAEQIRELPIGELVKLAQGAARALPRVVQTERLARGQSTTNVGGHDGGPIETESRVAAEAWAKGASDAELEAFLLGAEAQRAAAEQEDEKASSSKPKRRRKAAEKG